MGRSITTPKFRVSYPALAEPKGFEGQEPKFSVVMLFDKKTTNLDELKKIMQEAAEEKWPDAKKRATLKLHNPLRDGDAEKPDVDGYAGCWFVTAKASPKQMPFVPCVDRNKIALSKDQIKFDIYAGCYCRARIHAYAFDTAGNRGVSISLEGVQKMGDGDSLTGRVNVENAFDVVEDDGFDFGL